LGLAALAFIWIVVDLVVTAWTAQE